MRAILSSLFLAFCLNGFAASYYVSPTGNNASDGLSTNTPWATLRKGITTMAASDILYLMPGVHSDDGFLATEFKSGTSNAPTIIKSLFWYAQATYRPVLSNAAFHAISMTGKSNVLLADFVIDAVNSAFTGLKLTDCKNVTATNLTVANCKEGHGILTSPAGVGGVEYEGHRFLRCTVTNNGWAPRAGSSPLHALYLQGSYNIVDGCTIYVATNAWYGIHSYISEGAGGIYRGNKIFDARDAGIGLVGAGSVGFEIYNNEIRNRGAGGYGIRANKSTNCWILNNTLTGCSTAIRVENSDGVIVENNICTGEGVTQANPGGIHITLSTNCAARYNLSYSNSYSDLRINLNLGSTSTNGNRVQILDIDGTKSTNSSPLTAKFISTNDLGLTWGSAAISNAVQQTLFTTDIVGAKRGASGWSIGARQYVIPDPVYVDWKNIAGVEGGIPARSIYITLSATTTVAQMNAHIAACPSNQAVKLLAGTYDFTAAAIVAKPGVTVIGEGAATLLKTAHAIAMTLGYGRTNINLLSGYTVGSSNLVLDGNTPFLTNGCTVILSELNDPYTHSYGYEITATAPALFVGGDEPDGGTRNRGQVFRVVSISNGSNITVWPPVSGRGYQSNLVPRLSFGKPLDLPAVRNNLSGIGWQDFSITNGVGSMFTPEQVQNCWWSNVTFHIGAGDQAAIYGKTAHRVSIEHCNFYGHHPAASAVVPAYDTDGWKFENNAFVRCNQATVFLGRGGFHVWGYNWSMPTNSSTALISEVSIHGCGPQFILVEGSDFVKAHWDSIHGGLTDVTTLRSRARGQEALTTYGWGCFNVDSWAYFCNFWGNETGVEGQMSGWNYEEVAPADNSAKAEWALGYSGYNGAFWEIGQLTDDTIFRHGNVSFRTGSAVVSWDPRYSDQSVTNSLYLDQKPGWFGNRPWPLYGPGTGYANMGPAEYRIVYGVDPPPEMGGGGVGPSPETAPIYGRSKFLRRPL